MLEEIQKIARSAGTEILKIYGNFDVGTVEYKEDESPLTRADAASHQFIVSALEKLTPDIPVLSEESDEEETAARLSWEKFWLVDPLDGTKEFIKKTGEFTVNIALIENGEATLGVVYAPVIDVMYAALKGDKAYKSTSGSEPVEISVRSASVKNLGIVASKDHAGPQVSAMLEKIPNAELKSMGSSLKFCLVAEGAADLYPRFVPTMEWDTAAAQCILETAGGQICDLSGNRLRYQKDDLRNPSIISVGDPKLDWKQYLPL